MPAPPGAFLGWALQLGARRSPPPRQPRAARSGRSLSQQDLHRLGPSTLGRQSELCPGQGVFQRPGGSRDTVGQRLPRPTPWPNTWAGRSGWRSCLGAEGCTATQLPMERPRSAPFSGGVSWLPARVQPREPPRRPSRPFSLCPFAYAGPCSLLPAPGSRCAHRRRPLDVPWMRNGCPAEWGNHRAGNAGAPGLGCGGMRGPAAGIRFPGHWNQHRLRPLQLGGTRRGTRLPRVHRHSAWAWC